MRLLVSVRSVAEAQTAARGGVDFIDLKEPRDGALGGLPIATIADIVATLRGQGVDVPLSATIGDLDESAVARDVEDVLGRVHAVARCGVDYVKVGILPGAGALLGALAACGAPVVPVFIADRGLDEALIEQAAALRFPALMVDTADKGAGSLFDCLGPSRLQRFIAQARGGGALAGLAGALRLTQLPALAALAPDFAGFRSAVCAGDRGGALDAARLHELRRRVDEIQGPQRRSSPSSSERMRDSSAR
ncbi:MAG: hypothetical protein KGN16_20195 [Burkholderiales bacterium]|nr:hypothetical protein [Burkholderiales bacterium]